jgi:hypothetical protein
MPSPWRERVFGIPAAIYKDSCAACRRNAGTGEVHLFPRLAGSAPVRSDDPTRLVRVVLQGKRAVSTAGASAAPGHAGFRLAA